MATDASFLIPSSLHIVALLLGDDGGTIRAVSEATDVRCPVCGEPTNRATSVPHGSSCEACPSPLPSRVRLARE
jgi:hypothetical protein